MSVLEVRPTSQGKGLEYVSVSRLNLWMRCPRAFALRYREGVATPATESLLLGKAVHGVLERWYRHRQIGRSLSGESLEAAIHGAWKEAMEDGPHVELPQERLQNLKRKTAEMMDAYRQEYEDHQETVLACERPMQASLVDPRSGEDFGISLFGIADLVLDEADGPVVVDFKTAARASDGCPLDHELQLTAYAYLLRRATGRKESALEIRQLVKTKRPKVSIQRSAPRSEVHFERFFDLVREFRDGVLRGVFNLRPGWNCRMCGFRPWCDLSHPS